MGIHFSLRCCCLSDCRLSFCISNNKQPTRGQLASCLPKRQRSDFPGSKFPICSRQGPRRRTRNSPGCNRHRFPDLPDFFRRLAEPVLLYDRLPLAYRPRMRCGFGSAGGSCPRQMRKTPTACRCRQNKKHGNRRRLPDAPDRAAPVKESDASDRDR